MERIVEVKLPPIERLVVRNAVIPYVRAFKNFIEENDLYTLDSGVWGNPNRLSITWGNNNHYNVIVNKAPQDGDVTINGAGYYTPYWNQDDRAALIAAVADGVAIVKPFSMTVYDIRDEFVRLVKNGATMCTLWKTAGVFDFKNIKKKHKNLWGIIGQVMQYIYMTDAPQILTVKIEKFEHSKGAAYYHHENSCWWGQHQASAELFSADDDSYAIMAYDDDGVSVGRAWLYGNAENGVIFNPYDALENDNGEHILKALFPDVKLASLREIERKVDGPYINSGTHFKYGDYSKIPYFEGRAVTCHLCGDMIHESESYTSENDGCVYCQDCYWDIFSSCEDCGHEEYATDLTHTVNGFVCHGCIHHYESCAECNEYHPYGDINSETGKCENCGV